MLRIKPVTTTYQSTIYVYKIYVLSTVVIINMFRNNYCTDTFTFLQCVDAVGWMTRRTSGP